MNDRYLVILTRASIDRFEHNRMFAIELTAAFAARGWVAKTIDYIANSNSVFSALRDEHCKFFVSFNGFGTELEMPTIYSGRLESAFKAFGKPVLDLMHDCPVHESMTHQLRSNFNERRLFITDFRYAQLASELGIKTVVPSPSITFPHNSKTIGPAGGRSIPVLFAAGFLSPKYVADRYEPRNLRDRVFRSIFEEVITACDSDWSLDPCVLVYTTFAHLGIRFDGFDVDHRFVLTTVLDYVKLSRRHAMLEALRGLPVTLVADRTVSEDLLWPEVSLQASRSAIELLALMKKSQVVICPTTHVSGFHERPLGAFSMQATVVSSPCIPLQASFVEGREAFFPKNASSLRENVETLLADLELCREVALSGFKKAHEMFGPQRLVDAMLNFLH